MASPKIRIKRGSGAPTSAAIPSSGEMALDTANKSLFITVADGTTPTWIGAQIETSPADWTSSTKLATQSAINTTFLPKTGGQLAGNITTVNGSITTIEIPKLKIKQRNGTAGTGVTLQGPANVATDYTLTLPSADGANNQFLKTDGSGNLSWASSLSGITLTELTPTDTGDYGLLMSNASNGASVSSVNYDFAGDVQGLAPSAPKNGPIKYNKSSGTLTVNGNMIVNGQAANLVMTPAAAGGVSNNATSFTLSTVSGLSLGQQVYVNENFSPPSTGGPWVIEFPNESTITNIDTGSKVITVSTPITITANGVNSSLTSGQVTNLLKFATGTVVLGVDPGNGNNSVRLFNTDVDALNIGGSASTVSIGATSGLLSIPSSVTLANGASNIASLDFNSSTTTANLANTVPATTLNIGGAATTTNLGKTGGATTTIRSNTINIANDTGSSAKTINIGTGGSGDATVTIGRSSGSTQTHTIYGKISNSGFGTLGSSDGGVLVTKSYVDSVAAAGLTSKGAVRVATTTSGTLSSSFANGSTVDGVTLATNDRILIKDQTTKSENGIYTVNASGTPTRATDADEAVELAKGTYVFVTAGTANAGKGFILRTGVVTLGTDSLDWDQFTTTTNYTFSNGLTNTSGTITVNPATNGGLSVTGSGVSVASTFAGSGLTLSSGVLTVDGITEVVYATTGPFNAGYSNGTSGDGATLTNGGTQAAFSIDGASPAQHTRILVKNQTNTAQNGIYTLTTVGSGSANWVLTRAADFNVAAELQQLNTVLVTSGAANGGKTFNLLTKGTITVGTTGLNFTDSSTEVMSTDSRYFIVGANRERTNLGTNNNITSKSVAIIAGYSAPTGNSLSAEGTITFSTSSSKLSSDIIPGMKITFLGTIYPANLVVETVNYNAGTFVARNRGTSAITSIPGTPGTVINQNIIFDGASGASTSADQNYDNIGHRGMMIFDKSDMTSWSALGYNTGPSGSYTDGYWSIVRSETDGLGNREYPIVTTNTAQTLLSKTLTSPIVNTPSIYNPSILNFTLRTAQNTSSTGGNASTANLTKNFNDTITISEEETNTGLSEISAGVIKFTSPALRVVDGTFDNTVTGLQIFDDNHNLVNGALVQAITTGSVQFTNNAYYYVRTLSPSTIQLYDTYANSINTASTSGVINHTSITTNASNTLRFKVFSNIITLGKSFRALTDTSGIVSGSFVKLAMPNPTSIGFNTDYDVVLGDLNEVSITKTTDIIYAAASSSSTLKWTDQSNGANNLTLSGLTGSLLLYTDGNVSTKQINYKLYTGTTSITANHIQSVAISGTTMTITLVSGQGDLTNVLRANNYITLANCTGFSNPTDNKLVNYIHYITATAYNGTNTTITCSLRRSASGAATITTGLPVAIYNYEVKFGMSKRTDFPIGSKVAFAKGTSTSPSLNVQKLTGEYSTTNEGEGSSYEAVLATRFDLSTTSVLCFRLPYILCLSSSPTVPYTSGSGLEGEGLNSTNPANSNYIKITITQPNTDYNTPYNGRRILLNTLIDCGTY